MSQIEQQNDGPADRWWVQDKSNLTVLPTTEWRAHHVAASYYEDATLILGRGYFETPYCIYAKNRDALAPAVDAANTQQM